MPSLGPSVLIALNGCTLGQLLDAYVGPVENASPPRRPHHNALLSQPLFDWDDEPRRRAAAGSKTSFYDASKPMEAPGWFEVAERKDIEHNSSSSRQLNSQLIGSEVPEPTITDKDLVLRADSEESSTLSAHTVPAPDIQVPSPSAEGLSWSEGVEALRRGSVLGTSSLLPRPEPELDWPLAAPMAVMWPTTGAAPAPASPKDLPPSFSPVLDGSFTALEALEWGSRPRADPLSTGIRMHVESSIGTRLPSAARDTHWGGTAVEPAATPVGTAASPVGAAAAHAAAMGKRARRPLEPCSSGGDRATSSMAPCAEHARGALWWAGERSVRSWRLDSVHARARQLQPLEREGPRRREGVQEREGEVEWGARPSSRSRDAGRDGEPKLPSQSSQPSIAAVVAAGDPQSARPRLVGGLGDGELGVSVSVEYDDDTMVALV